MIKNIHKTLNHSSISTGTLIASLAIFGATSVFSQSPALAQNNHNLRTITLTGVGEVRSVPDMAIIQIGVIREAKTARKAVTLNNIAMQKIIEIVSDAGIENKDIQTSNFSLRPKYIYPQVSKSYGQKPPQIVAYSVSSNLAITVRKLPQLGAILDSVVSAGSNNIGNIRFSIQNPKPLRNKARRAAMQDAIAKAKLYASEAGFSLGAIKSVSEYGSARPPVPIFRQAAPTASYKRASVPIAQGQQSVRMQVNVVWEIK